MARMAQNAGADGEALPFGIFLAAGAIWSAALALYCGLLLAPGPPTAGSWVALALGHDGLGLPASAALVAALGLTLAGWRIARLALALVPALARGRLRDFVPFVMLPAAFYLLLLPWTAAERGASSFLGQSGTLVGLRGLKRGLVLDVNPVMTARSDGAP